MKREVVRVMVRVVTVLEAVVRAVALVVVVMVAGVVSGSGEGMGRELARTVAMAVARAVALACRCIWRRDCRLGRPRGGGGAGENGRNSQATTCHVVTAAGANGGALHAVGGIAPP